jgi:hypothetical protein
MNFNFNPLMLAWLLGKYNGTCTFSNCIYHIFYTSRHTQYIVGKVLTTPLNCKIHNFRLFLKRRVFFAPENMVIMLDYKPFEKIQLQVVQKARLPTCICNELSNTCTKRSRYVTLYRLVPDILFHAIAITTTMQSNNYYIPLSSWTMSSSIRLQTK